MTPLNGKTLTSGQGLHPSEDQARDFTPA